MTHVTGPAPWPVPLRMEVRPGGFTLPSAVGLVAGADTDEAALRTVRAVLAAAGVSSVPAGPGAEVTVWLAGGGEVLARLGTDGEEPSGEGYVLAAGRYDGRAHIVLAAGRYDGRAHIVLAGGDGAGTYYAALTLGQVIDGSRVPEVVVRDRPAMRYRGSVEGFYGTPWSHAERLDHLAYLGAHKMNTYVYAPKDDPYHRERWRVPYPSRDLARLGELVACAREGHVELTFALSPGLSMHYSSGADLEALLGKFEAVYALGCRSFNVPFDDIDHETWHDPADREAFGDGAAGAGAAQAHVLNEVQAWARAKGDVRPLQTVPTEYADVDETPYKRALRERLDPGVVVHWTGVGVVPETITVEQAARAREVFGHPILIWDNHPVNDYAHGRLPLGAYTGREPGLSAQVAGVVSNPANQAAVSKVALYSFAGFGWHDTSFDAHTAWCGALEALAGGDPRTAAALRAFADVLTYDGTLHRTRAPSLAAAVSAFWAAGPDDRTRVAALRARVAGLAAAPAAIRAGVTDAAFAEEARAWLDATELWAEAMGAALDLLSEGPVRAESNARRIDALAGRANTLRDARAPHDRTAPLVGDGVIDTFLDTAKAAGPGAHDPPPPDG